VKVQAAHSADQSHSKKEFISYNHALAHYFHQSKMSVYVADIFCNTAKSCNKIQRSQNTGESVSRIGFKRETGEMT